MTASSPLKPTHSTREKLRLILVALIGIFCYSILAGFFIVRLAAPGDGTQVLLPLSGLVSEGLPLRPFVPTPDGLRPNDIVTAIDDHTVNDLIRDAVTGNSNNSALLEKSSLQYMVLRGGNSFSIPVQLAPFPLVLALEDNWEISLAMVLMLAIALFVLLRCPYQLSAQLFFLGFTLAAVGTIPWAMGHQASDLLRGWVIPFETAVNNLLYFFGIAIALHFFLIFPRRHPLVVKYPRLIIWNYLGVWIIYFVSFLLRFPAATTPAAFLQLRLQSENGSILYFALIVLVIFSNLRHLTDETEIRQMRWVAWGMLVGLGGIGMANFLAIVLGLPVQFFLGVAGLLLIAIPVSIAIAILKANLFDINLIINRTLVYVPLTAILAGLFAATITLTQKVFVGLTGAGSDAAVVMTTLLIVAAFTPIKDRLQKFVDSHFKEAPDPLKELKAYREQTNSVLQVIDPEAIARHTLDVTVKAFDAECGAIYWGDRMDKPFYTTGKWHDERGFDVPLITDDGLVLACLSLGARRNGKAYTDRDRVALQENLALATRALVLAQHSSISRID